MRGIILLDGGFSIAEVLFGLFLAALSALGINYAGCHLSIPSILDLLQKFVPIFALLGIAGWHLKLKLLELTGRPGLSLPEQRRLTFIISDRIKVISFLIYFYILNASILLIGPAIGGMPHIGRPTAMIGAAMLAISLYSGLVILSSFREMSSFKMLLDRREKEVAERERLLKKISDE